MKILLVVLFGVFQVASQAVEAGDVFKGREVYVRDCVLCHGASGDGRLPGLRSFQESQALYRSDDALKRIVRDGKGVMPSFNGLLSDEDIRNVVIYLRTFL